MAHDASVRKDVDHRRHDTLLDGVVEMRRERDHLGFTARPTAVQQVNDWIAPFLAGRVVVAGRQIDAVADIDNVGGAAERTVLKAGVLALGNGVDPFE